MTLSPLGMFLVALFLFVLVLGIVVLTLKVISGERAERIRIWISAFRVGVQDKGHIGFDSQGVTWAHRFCLTRVRIGIHRKEKEPVQYCWRCEKILSAMDPSKPSPGILAASENDQNVVRLDEHRKK